MIILVLKEAVLGEFGEEREEKGVKESPTAKITARRRENDRTPPFHHLLPYTAQKITLHPPKVITR
jgi:hypothetical protein